jgi:hypothetical protein
MSDFGAISAWLLLVVFIVGAALVAVGSVQLGSRVLSADTDPGHNSALSPYVTVVGLVYGALLGFTVVVGWQEFLSAEVNVSNEASTLTTMYRQTVAMPQPEQSQIREQLRQYAEGLQGPEWGKQDFGRISNRARAAITGMYRIVGSQQSNAASSPISQDFLGRLTVLASERSTRILDANPRIPRLPAPDEQPWSHGPDRRGRRPAWLTAVPRLRTRPPFWPTRRHPATICPRRYGFRRSRQRNVTIKGHWRRAFEG